MRKMRFAASVAAVALAASVSLGACSSSDDTKSDGGAQGDTEQTAADQNAADQALPGDPKVDPAIEKAVSDRGAPKLTAVEVPTELKVTDDIVGTGKEVKAGATVTVQYAGAAASTGVEFDSSWTRGAAATFPLDGVIEGWSKGLVGMKEGGRRTLVIPAELAYGNGGPAPGDALVFVVDLIAVSNG
ncbi:MAG: FKBP-type peptidyl-prolyl cis-trans isomerase [Microthrixaceae bacterium]